MTEKDWINYLKKYLFEDSLVLKAKNEDCAVIKINKNRYFLFTTDALVENIHFNLSYTSFFDLGVKLGGSNLSDIAAMGGNPKWGLLTIGSPNPIELNWAEPFMDGLLSTLKRFNTSLVGGDTVKSPFFFVSLALIGEAKNPILRKGTKPDEYIFVSRPLGESSAFLRFIKNTSLKDIPESLKLAHLRPEPEIVLGKELSSQKIPTSMIDISDGLLLDLWRICEENETGAEIWEEKIPVGKFATLKEALSGGEDYALLFTVKEENLKKLEKLSTKLNRTFFNIGKIIKDKKLYLVKENQKLEVQPEGFDHFKVA